MAQLSKTKRSRSAAADVRVPRWNLANEIIWPSPKNKAKVLMVTSFESGLGTRSQIMKTETGYDPRELPREHTGKN